MIDAHPLAWPTGRKRTRRSERSRFDRRLTTGRARDELIEELRRLGAAQVVISTNMPLRRDGGFYASAREPDDPGVAVYFHYKGRQKCFSCDKWDSLRDNIWAIRKTIESIRGIERWGSGEMVEAAFAGFDALPAPGETEDPYSILGVNPDDTFKQIRKKYLARMKISHPDNGGMAGDAAKLSTAFTDIKRQRGLVS